MNSTSELLTTLKVLMVFFAPLISLGVASSLSNAQLERGARAQVAALSRHWAPQTFRRWEYHHAKQYSQWASQLPKPQPHVRSGNTIGSAGVGAGDTFEKIYNFMARAVDHAVYALAWVAWPRLILWRLYFPVGLLLLIAASVDAYCTRQKRRYSFFVPRLSVSEGTGWLIVLGAVISLVSLFWPSPLTDAVPAVGCGLIALGVMLRYAIPVVGA